MLLVPRAAERFDQVRGEQLAAAQGRVDPFARKRVEEVGGVAHQRGTGCPCPPRSRRERTGGANRGYTLRPDEALGGARDEKHVLPGYDRARKREFGGKWKLERIVGMAIAYPWFLNNAAKVLSKRKDMADLLAGVAGDYVPAELVLSPRFLFNIFISPAFQS